MGQVAAIDRLPTTVKAWLQQRLREAGFGDYDAITSELAARLQAIDWQDAISRSSVGRFAKGFKDEIEQMQKDARMASHMVEILGNDTETIARANRMYGQTHIMRIFQAAEERALEPKEIATLVRASADAERAGIAQAKWQEEIQRKAAKAAEETEKVLTGAGLVDPATLAQVREQIYGIGQ